MKKVLSRIILWMLLAGVSWGQTWLSGISVAEPSQTSAVITWVSAVPATSVVNYGTTSGYGTTVNNATLVTNHSVTITGLTTGVTYHFQVQSVDSAGLPVTTADSTFTALIGYALSVSASSDRSSASSLNGATISGTRYVFTTVSNAPTNSAVTGVSKVQYWLDNPTMSGAAIGSDTMTPFDFSSGASIPAFKQVNAATPQTPTSPVTVTYTGAQTAGDLNIVVIGRSNTTSGVNSVTDTKGNTYTMAGNGVSSSSTRQTLWYAKNIAAAAPGANTVTVTFDVAPPYPDVRILEYSGLDTASPFDVISEAGGFSATPNSGSISTTSASELLFAAGTTGGTFNAAGSGFTSRIITSPDGDIAEDRFVNASGSYSATAALVSSNNWVMEMATFRAATSVNGWNTTGLADGTHTITEQVTRTDGSTEVDTSTFTVNNAVHSSSMAWTAGVGVTNPVRFSVYRSTTNGGPYTRIASGIVSPSYSDTAVVSKATYYYVVTEVDQVTSKESGFSNQSISVIP